MFKLMFKKSARTAAKLMHAPALVLSLLPFAAFAAERTFSVVTCGGVPRLAVDGVPCVGTAAMPSPKVAPGKSVTALADFDRQGIRFYSDV